jgi:hypothetical protein
MTDELRDEDSDGGQQQPVTTTQTGSGSIGGTVTNTNAPTGGAIKESGESSLGSSSQIKNNTNGATQTGNPNYNSDSSYGSQSKTYSNALDNCSSYNLPTKVKLLRTHDKTFFSFFIDRTFTQKFKYRTLTDVLLNTKFSFTGGTSGNFWCSASNSADVFYADSVNDGTSKKPILLPVFFMDTPSSFDLFPSVISFDITYDDDTKMADLVAWVNYYGYNGPNDYVDTDDEDILKQSSKMLVYAKGSYKLIKLSGSQTGTILQTHAFIFSAPVPIFIPRLVNNKNALVTSIPQTHFYEYKA